MPTSKELAERRNSNVQVDFTKEAQREFEKLSPKEKEIRILEGKESTLKIQIRNLENKIRQAQEYGYNEDSYKKEEIELRKTRNELKKVKQDKDHSNRGKKNFQRLAKKAISQSQKNEHMETNNENRTLTTQQSTANNENRTLTTQQSTANNENRTLTTQQSTTSKRDEIFQEIQALSKKIVECEAELKKADFADSDYTSKLNSVKKLLKNAEIEKQKVTKKKEAIENPNWFKKCFRFMFRGDQSKLKKYDESLVELKTNIKGLNESISSLQQEVKTHEDKKTNLEAELVGLKAAKETKQQEFGNIGNQKDTHQKHESPTRKSFGERQLS